MTFDLTSALEEAFNAHGLQTSRKALPDNVDWPDGGRVVEGCEWPEGTLWARHFLMLIPG